MQVQHNKQEVARGSSHELYHFTCCIDLDIALCGTDVSDHLIKEKTFEQQCKVCEYLDQPEMWDFCPRFNSCLDED